MAAEFKALPRCGPLTPAPGPLDWPELMDRAIALAKLAGELGEIPVGALVLSPAGETAGMGKNEVEERCDPTAHAEILAIRQACRHAGNYRLEGHILICTLEPCQMCAAAILEARLGGVVFGASDPARGAVVSRAEYLEAPLANKRIWHMGGICASACALLLNNFFAAVRGRGPRIRLRD